LHIETRTWLQQLQDRYFETQDRVDMNNVHDAVEVIAYLAELYENGFTENAC
jgi:hypothetical protein